MVGAWVVNSGAFIGICRFTALYTFLRFYIHTDIDRVGSGCRCQRIEHGSRSELQAIEIRNVINARQPLVNGISQNGMNRSTLYSGKGAIQ